MRAAAANRSALAMHAVSNGVSEQVLTKDGTTHGTGIRIALKQLHVNQFNETFITIARGLFQHHFGVPIPRDTSFDVLKYEKPDYEKLILDLGATPTLSMGAGVFTWYCLGDPTTAAKNIQILCFHGGFIAGVICRD